MEKTVKPYKEVDSGKKEQVAQMFDNISGNYDFLNHFFSMGIDFIWRKKTIKLLKKDQPEYMLDIATGTGDFAIAALKINPKKVIGVDISNGMLEKGREKLKKKKLEGKIELKYGDSENLPFDDNEFNAITVGFGVRNFENLEKGLSDMRRVLKPNGTAAILEFSKAKKFPIKQLYNFYFRRVIPLLGKLISKDKSAYTYLPESVEAFPEGEDFLAIMRHVGYRDVKCIPVSGGIASIYLGKK